MDGHAALCPCNGNDHAASSTFSTPRRIWSSSIDSNSALKLPSPNPSSPLRWMNSKKIGPIALAEKICSSTLVWPPSTTPSPSIRMPFALQPRHVLAMPRQARVDLLEIGLRRRRHERQAGGAQRLDGAVDIARAAGDMLDALAAIGVEIFLDLPGIAGILVDRNPDLAVRAGQRAREQAGGAALDVEEADLAEVEQLS